MRRGRSSSPRLFDRRGAVPYFAVGCLRRVGEQPSDFGESIKIEDKTHQAGR